MSDSPMVRCGTVVRSHDEIRSRAARLASGLAGLGVGHGERYAIVLRNSIEFLEATMAGAVIGAVPVPVNWHWTGDDLEHLLVDSGSALILVGTGLLAGVEAVAPEGTLLIEVADGSGPLTGRHEDLERLIARHEAPVGKPLDPPLGVIYTSGTTGLPKGILREPMTPEQSVQVGRALLLSLAATPSMSTLIPAPMYHTAPNAHAVFAVALGMDLEIMPRFDAERFLALVQDKRVQHAQMVPTMFVRLLKLPAEIRAKYDVSSIEAIVHAAAPCSVDVKKGMIDWFGPVIHEFYGGSETGSVVKCDSAEWLAHPGTVGKPFLDAAARVLDPVTLEDLPVGESGDIYLKPFGAWPDFTYIGNDAKRADMEHEGYLTIGDIGYLDEDGYLYLNDRRNDMINKGGVNIYPAEIEASLLGMDGIADAAVFGIPDADLGETIAAHLERSPGAAVAEEEVRRYLGEHLAKYKTPSVIVFEERLPREDTGKLFKRRLKEQYWAGAGNAV